MNLSGSGQGLQVYRLKTGHDLERAEKESSAFELQGRIVQAKHFVDLA